MTSSHGCAGLRGRSKPLAALALALAFAFGLALAADRPARACHISHQDHAKSSTSTTAETTPAPASVSAPAATTALVSGLTSVQPHVVVNPVDDQGKAEPQVIAATPSSAPATRSMMPSGSADVPTVRDWHQFTATACMPPTPPAAVPAASPTAQAQAVAPPNAPLAFMNPPTPAPAPEPSTILSALALAGAFAWRRRANRPHA